MAAGEKARRKANVKKNKGLAAISRKKAIVFAVSAAAVIYFVATLISQQILISKQNRQIRELESSIESAQGESERLKSEVDNLNNPEYIEKIAREQLGLVRPNERVFVDANKSENNK